MHRILPTAAPTASPEYVVLVDPDGNPVGRRLKSVVHSTETPLHLAFSLYLFDPAGRVLLTRRALSKATWPGVWTNSCCGHPMPGETMADAIERRATFELGVSVTELRLVLPDFSYRARDAGGIEENEICPVYAATVTPSVGLRPNVAEVMDVAWVPWDDIVTAAAATPFAFSPWAVDQVRQLASVLVRRPAEITG